MYIIYMSHMHIYIYTHAYICVCVCIYVRICIWYAYTFTIIHPNESCIWYPISSAGRPPFTSWSTCWCCSCYQMRCLQDIQGDVGRESFQNRYASHVQSHSKHVQVHWKLQLAFSTNEINESLQTLNNLFMNLRNLTLMAFKGSATSALRAARGTLAEADWSRHTGIHRARSQIS